MTDDPTTTAIVTLSAERDQLRVENQRLGQALIEARTEVEALKAEGDRLFVAGYEQAVREIRDYFTRPKNPEVLAEIEKIWMGKPTAYPPPVRKS